MFKFYLNNTLVSDPMNWSDFTETIERDEVIKGLLPKYEIQLKFNAGGYKFLYDLKQSAGFCNLVELKVQKQSCSLGLYSTILDGYIFLSDCKFNINKCTVECDVFDNNYGARIYNNKSISVYLDSSLSKNLVSITPAVSKDVTFFRPSTGADIVGLRRTYPVWECFKYLIAFMSDGLIDFESTFLDYTATHTDNRQRALVITTGAILRGLSGSPSPKISFDILFQEVNKKYPIAFSMTKQANGRSLIKIENEDYFFGSDSGVRFANVNDITESINNRLLYSEIGIGGETATYDSAIHSLPDSIRMMFKNESYYFQTECNIDNKLDLVTSFICDSNIIEELVFTNMTNTSYNDNVFFVEVIYSSGIAGNTAIKTSVYDSSATPYYYNAGLTNVAVANNLNVYSDLVQFVNSNDIGFMATKTDNFLYPYHKIADYPTTFSGLLILLYSTSNLVLYQDDSTAPNHDAGNNYTANSRYTAPSNGNYYFKSNLKLKVDSDLVNMFGFPANPNIKIGFFLNINKYSAANVLLESYQTVVGGTTYSTLVAFNSPIGYASITGEKMFFLETGQYVETYFKWASLPNHSYSGTGHYNGEPTSGRVTILPTSTFETLTTEGNGTLISGNSLNYNVEKLEFELPVSDAEYANIKTDTSKYITIDNGVDERVGWIRKSVRNMSTTVTTCELITNLNNNS